jgi:Fur family zinc uptake transcriptional regulator
MSATTHKKIEHRLDEAAALCKTKGAQLTPLRRAVLALILAAEGPVTAYQLLDRLKESRAGAVPPTVYRALDFLSENRLIHRLERLNAFIPCMEADHQHHAAQFLICGRCGTVAEIEDSGVANALAKAAEKAGFQPSNALVELDGLCAACITAAELRPSA